MLGLSDVQIKQSFDKILDDSRYLKYGDTAARREAVARVCGGPVTFKEYAEQIRQRSMDLKAEIKSQIDMHKLQLDELETVIVKAKGKK
jgi:hypothetical protein